MGRVSLYFGMLFVMLSSAGCGNDGLRRVIIDGTVTLNGKPVEDGQIRYIPLETTPGPITIAPIRQGRYRCGDKGGVPLGKHRVEIFAWDPQVPDGGRGAPLRPQWVPEKYNESSQLVETIEGDGDVVEKNFNL